MYFYVFAQLNLFLCIYKCRCNVVTNGILVMVIYKPHTKSVSDLGGGS